MKTKLKHFSIQYISPELNVNQFSDHLGRALIDGVKWFQLRQKNKDPLEFAEMGLIARKLCDKFGATFIVNDHVEIAIKVGADGVHLGKNDMSITEARLLLGDEKIIGATANTLEEVLGQVACGADYIGLGPFAFTRTKENLSPVLGINGYETILAEIKSRGIDTPIAAIGGIVYEDCESLRSVGVDGLAFSGLLKGEPFRKNLLLKLGALNNEINLKDINYGSIEYRQ